MGASRGVFQPADVPVTARHGAADIVDVLRPHGQGGKIHMKRDEPAWDVRCEVEMVWTFPGSERHPHRAKEGPAPDSRLWQIWPSPKRAKSAAKVLKERADALPCDK